MPRLTTKPISIPFANLKLNDGFAALRLCGSNISCTRNKIPNRSKSGTKWGISQAKIIDYQSKNAPFSFFSNMGHFKKGAKQKIKKEEDESMMGPKLQRSRTAVKERYVGDGRIMAGSKIPSRKNNGQN